MRNHFRVALRQITQQELPDVSALLDLSEHPLHLLYAQRVAFPRPFRLQLPSNAVLV
jgi:predicted DNA-binding transcriptional regulator AlpA